MKKYIAVILLAGVMLGACNKDAGIKAAESDQKSTAAKDASALAAEDENAKAEVAAAKGSKEAAEEAPCALFNDFFCASLKNIDIPEGEDEMMTVTFQFVNTTDKTYYKNDEEIPAGEGWEKVITYPKKKWEGMAGEVCWIHYDLYEDAKMQDEIFKGGLKFTVGEDLNMTDMSIFEE